MMAKYDAGNPAALRRLIAGGTKLQAFPTAVMETCHKAAREVTLKRRRRIPTSRKSWNPYGLPNSGYQWFQVAEIGYDNFMARNSRG